MASIILPSYLTPMVPGYSDYYFDRRTGHSVRLVPEQVQHLYLQEQIQIEQWNTQHAFMRNAYGQQLPQAQIMQADFPAANHAQHFAAPVHTQAQPIINSTYIHGNINLGTWNNGSHQLGHGNHHVGNHHAGSQQHSPWGPQPNGPVNFGGYNAPSVLMRTVHRVQPQMQQNEYVPTSAPVPSPPVIDLTDDNSVDAPDTASTSTNSNIGDQPAATEEQVANEVETASVPRVKSSPSAWKRGMVHLDKKLNDQGGSDPFRLFESMKILSPRQRDRYCEAHWPAEQDAYDDINNMSKWFLDAAEMMFYAPKWDSVAALPVLQNPSKEERLEREKLHADIAAEKVSLELALPEKRKIQNNREEHGRWSNWVERMKAREFEKNFGIKRTPAAVKEVIREREEELAREREAASTKRKAHQAPAEEERPGKKTRTAAPRSHKPKSLSAPVRSVSPAESEDIEQILMKGFEEEEPAAIEAATPVPAVPEDLDIPPLSPGPLLSRPRSPFRNHSVCNLDLVDPEDYPSIPAGKLLEHITTSNSILAVASREEDTTANTEEDETFPEQVTAPSPSPDFPPREENTVVENADEGYSSPLAEKPSEQATAPISPATLTSSEENAVVNDETFSEQATVPTLLTPTAQEEKTVVAEERSDEEINDLFEDDEAVTEEENTSTTDVEAVEDLPAPVPEITAEMAANELPQEEDIEEASTPAPEEEVLMKARLHHTDLLAQKQVEIAAVEQNISHATTHPNLLMRKRLEKSRPANEAKLQVLKDELDVLLELSEGEKLEMWKESVGVLVEGKAEYLKGVGKPVQKRVAGSCGGSKLAW